MEAILLSAPVNEVISKAKEDHQRDFDSFTDKRPFAGLVKTNPRKALSALTLEGKRGESMYGYCRGCPPVAPLRNPANDFLKPLT